MNKLATIETERLTLLPGRTRRDDAAFLNMLREDGDFQMFCGVPFSEENLRNFSGYLQRGCRWAMYRRGAPDTLLGYVGLDRQYGRYEAEFYVKRDRRGNGYGEEGLRAVCREAFSGELADRLALKELRATTSDDNLPAKRLLEKCGFTRPEEGPVLALMLLYDSEGVGHDVAVADYVLKKDQEAV